MGEDEGGGQVGCRGTPESMPQISILTVDTLILLHRLCQRIHLLFLTAASVPLFISKLVVAILAEVGLASAGVGRVVPSGGCQMHGIGPVVGCSPGQGAHIHRSGVGKLPYQVTVVVDCQIGGD